MTKKILLDHKLAPGDTTVLTGLVRDIKAEFGDEFQIGVRTTMMELWQNNPHVERWTDEQARDGVEHFKISYGQGLRDQRKETVHFMPYFHRVFGKRFEVDVPVTLPYPDIHLSQTEQDATLIEGRYWVVFAGGKSDFTAKVWKHKHFQHTVDMLKEWGIQVVQMGAAQKGHWHPPLENVLDVRGQYSARNFLQLIHKADGVICPITFGMHAAAALQRPCVVLGGGREAWFWEAYVRENAGLHCPEKLKVPHRYLHTIGLLDCCKSACWKNKVEMINEDDSLCKRPIRTPGQTVPECLEMTTPEMVTTAVLSYYLDGTLPLLPGTEIADAAKEEGILP